jgi:uncharacterized protein
VLLKLHSRCNLACGYCYVYESIDQSWRRRPTIMSRPVIDAAASRIGEHTREWGLSTVTVILHGGEPLLAGADTIGYTVSAVRAAVPAGTKVEFTVQTNGLLLDVPMLEALRQHHVRVGISLDGDRGAHDRHRRFSHGGGSYDQVASALNILRQDRYRHLFSGLLCTIDIRNDPVSVYESLLAFEPPRMDFLLPHGNWTNPPPLRPIASQETPYGDWLVGVFDRWYDSPRYTTEVRLFSSIISLLMGGVSRTESVGLDPVDYLVVETDGSLEQADALKTVADGIAATGLDVFTHTFTDALAHEGIRARQLGLDALSDTCRSCAIVKVCGGGLYAHRYQAPDGFRHPTVYCPDQRRLITHIRDRVAADLRRRTSGRPVSDPGLAAR